MAAVSWAVGTILIKRLRSRCEMDLLSLTAWQLLMGAVPLLLLAVAVTRPLDGLVRPVYRDSGFHVDRQHRAVLVAMDLHTRSRTRLGGEPVGARLAGRCAPCFAPAAGRGVPGHRGPWEC